MVFSIYLFEFSLGVLGVLAVHVFGQNVNATAARMHAKAAT
ncbi:MAG: hypothetical protein RL616_1168 [Verrucomicrobiota bacterium]